MGHGSFLRFRGVDVFVRIFLTAGDRAIGFEKLARSGLRLEVRVGGGKLEVVDVRPTKGHLQSLVQLEKGGVGRTREGAVDGGVADVIWIQLNLENVVGARAGLLVCRPGATLTPRGAIVRVVRTRGTLLEHGMEV